MVRCMLLALVGLAWLGCYAAGIKVDEHQLHAFQEGQTTYFDVVAALGKPTSLTIHSDRTSQAIYIYTQGQANWQTFVPIASALARGSSSEQTTAVLDFDAQKVLLRYTFTQGNITVGTGLDSGKKQ